MVSPLFRDYGYKGYVVAPFFKERFIVAEPPSTPVYGYK